MFRKETKLLVLLSLATTGLLLAYTMILTRKSKVMRYRGESPYSTPQLSIQQFKAETWHLKDTESVGFKCKIRRPPLLKTKNILSYINGIKNCPCNVNKKSELNPLCATNDTLEDVTKRTPVEFLPETSSPCFFIDTDEHQYYIANTSNSVNRQEKFLQSSPKSLLGCLPSLFLLGIGKTATTEMHALLTQHQQIKGSERKEMTFWSGGSSYETLWYRDDDNNNRYNLYAYMQLSNKVSKTIHNIVRQTLVSDLPKEKTILDSTLILDSSNNNYKMESMQNICNFIPNPRVIFSMRNPVEREFSKFRYSAQLEHMKDKSFINDQTPEGFDRYVRHVLTLPKDEQFPQCNYSGHVKNILQVFPRSQVGFVQFEEFIKDPLGILERDILPVFAVDPFNEKVKEKIKKVKKYNRTVRFYKMLNSTRKMLQDHFRDQNRELSRLLNDAKWTWGY